MVVCAYALEEATSAPDAKNGVPAPSRSADAESCAPCSITQYVYNLLQVLAGETLVLLDAANLSLALALQQEICSA